KPYDGKMVAYLDLVGKMHTSKAGATEIVVPLVQMNALLGFVADGLTNTIASLGLERQQEVRTLRAFTKLLWLQNDLINRHYQAPAVETAGALPHNEATPRGRFQSQTSFLDRARSKGAHPDHFRE